MSGWVKLHRKIADNTLFKKNAAARHVFTDLLHLAAWSDCQQDWNGKPVDVARGQVMISTRELADYCGMTHQKIRTIVSVLMNHQIIKINTDGTSRPSIISICNYCAYQDHQHRVNTATNTDLAQTQHTKEEEEEVKKIEELSLVPPPGGGETKVREKKYPEWFERFWTAYPGTRKQLKGKCLDLAKAAISAKTATPDQFAKAIDERRGCNKDPAYQMAPERWLRNKGWLDEVPEWAGTHSNGSDKMTADEFANLLRQHGYSEEQINEQTRAMQ